MANRNTKMFRSKTARHGNLTRDQRWLREWHKEHGVEHDRANCKRG